MILGALIGNTDTPSASLMCYITTSAPNVRFILNENCSDLNKRLVTYIIKHQDNQDIMLLFSLHVKDYDICATRKKILVSS